MGTGLASLGTATCWQEHSCARPQDRRETVAAAKAASTRSRLVRPTAPVSAEPAGTPPTLHPTL